MLKNLIRLSVLSLAVTAVAHATPITSGNIVVASTISFTPVGSSLGYVNSTSPSGTSTANYTAAVYNDSSNIFCSACLTFVFTIADTGSSSISQLEAGFFGPGYLYNVGYNGAGVNPSTIKFSSNGLFDFNFTALNGGTYSSNLIIQTNATRFQLGTIYPGPTVATTVAGAQPTGSPVPEPGTLALMGTGIAGLVGAAKRRFNA